MGRSNKKRHYDETLLTVVVILVAVGLVMLYSTSSYNGGVKFHYPLYSLKKQGVATFIGFLGTAIWAWVVYPQCVGLSFLG